MYKAYLNNQIFFDTNSDLKELSLISADLSREVGTAGTFTFKIAPTNTAYSSVQNISDYVDVYRDNTLLFSGRVYSIEGEFNTVLTVTCEGLFALFNDSVIRPFTFNDTVEALITELISRHNAQVGADKQITVGTIGIAESSNIVYRAYEDYTSTMQRLLDLQDTFGGYMSVDKVNGVLVFNWAAAITDEASQRIDFGANLLDVTQTEDASQIVTVLVPLGAEIVEENGLRRRINLLDVQEYYQQGIDYIENASAIAEYGRIVGTYTWDDVTVPEHLVGKATEYLNSVSARTVSINVRAVDLAAINTSVDAFEVGTRIYVHSDAHGLDQYFNCLVQELNLVDPTSDELVLGTTQYGYIGRQNKIISKLESTQNTIIANYAINGEVAELNGAVNDLTQQVTQNTTEIEQNANEINLRATTTDFNTLAQKVAELEVTSDNIAFYFGDGTDEGMFNTWYQFTEDKLIIGKAGADLHTEQDNDSYSIVDGADNVLFTITPDGTRQETAEVEKQVKFSYNGAAQWAIREANYRQGVGVNLNDVWIGG